MLTKTPIYPLGVTRFVDGSVSLGSNVRIWHFAVVLGRVVLGDDVSIGARAEIGQGSQIGPRSRISSGVFLPSNSKVGCNVFIGPNVTFTDDKYPIAGNRDYDAQPPVIEDCASIGAGAVILPGITIGKGALIGAGAIVTHDVKPFSHVRSEPAHEHTLSRRTHVTA